MAATSTVSLRHVGNFEPGHPLFQDTSPRQYIIARVPYEHVMKNNDTYMRKTDPI